MLDIRFIRDNPELVQENLEAKGYKVQIGTLLDADVTRRGLQQQADELREKRNAISSQLKGGRPSDELVAESKAIKETLLAIEADLKTADDTY